MLEQLHEYRVALSSGELHALIVEGKERFHREKDEILPALAIISDDAGQFNVLLHALCWIHAERVLAKLVGFNDEQRAALEEVRTVVWELFFLSQ